MENTQNLARLAELINVQRGFYGLTVEALARKAGVGLRTMHGWLRAENAPGVQNRAGLEAALGWLPGSVRELLEAEDPDSFSIEGMQAPATAAPASRAADLTDDELFLEVSHRLREWRHARAAVESMDSYGLAASSGHDAEDDDEGAPEESAF